MGLGLVINKLAILSPVRGTQPSDSLCQILIGTDYGLGHPNTLYVLEVQDMLSPTDSNFGVGDVESVRALVSKIL